MPRTRTSWLAILLLTVVVTSVRAARFDTDIVGTVVGVEGTTIVVKEMQGQLFRAETARSGPDIKGQKHTYRSECLIEVTGRELIKNLQPGMGLQLECRLANRRGVVGEVRKLTLVTLSPVTQLGVVSAEPVDDTDDEAKQPEPISTRKLEDCVVVCQLVKCKNGNLTLVFPGEKGNVELFVRRSADEELEVLGSDLGFVRPGDKIRAQGYTHGLPHFFARDVKIEHQPYVESKPSPAKADVAKNRTANKKEMREPFELGDPEDAAKTAGKAAEKVRLQVIKVN